MAMASALQVIAAQASTMPAPNRLEMAPTACFLTILCYKYIYLFFWNIM